MNSSTFSVSITSEIMLKVFLKYHFMSSDTLAICCISSPNISWLPPGAIFIIGIPPRTGINIIMAIKAGTTAEAAILILSRRKIVLGTIGIRPHILKFSSSAQERIQQLAREDKFPLIFLPFFNLYTSSKYIYPYCEKGIQLDLYNPRLTDEKEDCKSPTKPAAKNNMILN